jgi:hypothetical protein
MPCLYILLILVLAFLIFDIIVTWQGDRPRSLPQPVFTFQFYNIKIKGLIMAVELKDSQLVRGTLEFKDAKGNTATVQTGSVKFESSDEDVFTVEQNKESEVDLTIVAGRPGGAELRWSADADLGEGVKPISGAIAVVVESGEAVGAGVRFGEPEEQPAAEPAAEPATTDGTGQ